MTNTNTLFLLGAGFNQSVEDWNGLKPPLANNFFQTILKSEKFTDKAYFEKLKPLYTFIQDHWKKSKDDLLKNPFNLEDIFTFLQLKINEIDYATNPKEHLQLVNINFQLKNLLASFLKEFEIHCYKSEDLRVFTKLIWRKKPNIITFNYDCILEALIELVSMPRSEIPKSFYDIDLRKRLSKIPNELITYSHFNWNRPLSYGIKFNKVQLYQSGTPIYIDRNKFYNIPDNALYEWKILKLHGSLNWFKVLPIYKYSTPKNKDQKLINQIVLINGFWWINEPPDLNGWMLDPLIITPVLYKNDLIQQNPFKELWNLAKLYLEQCKQLIIIGYSFSQTDFSIKKLFLDVFSKNKLEELIIVNPDKSAAQIAVDFTHFDKAPTLCKDINEFLQVYE